MSIVSHAHFTVKGFPTLLRVVRPLDTSMDWIDEAGRPDFVPAEQANLHAWMKIESVLLKDAMPLSRPLQVIYDPSYHRARTGVVNIRIQGMLENANLCPPGEELW